MKLSKLYILAIVLLLALISVWTVARAELITLTIGGQTYQGDLQPLSTTQPATRPATQPADVVAPPTTQPGGVVTVEPPVPTVTTRGASGALKAIKLNGRPLRGSFELRDLLIDANGQSRVIEPAPGVRQVLRNCRIVNVGRSVVERSVVFADGDKPYELVLENVSTENTPGYTIYLDASWKSGKAMTDGAMVHVQLTRCDLGTSLYETVVRVMPGVAATIEDTRIWDAVDLGADGRPTSPPNKAHSALRGHGYSISVRESDIDGYAKFGFEKLPSQSVRLVDTKFTGGVEFEGVVRERYIDAVTVNGKTYR